MLCFKIIMEVLIMNIKTSNRIIMVLYVIVLFLLSIQVGKYYNKFVNNTIALANRDFKILV